MSTRMVLAVIALALLGVGAPEGIEKGTSVEGITEYVLDNGLRVLRIPRSISTNHHCKRDLPRRFEARELRRDSDGSSAGAPRLQR